LASRPRSLNQDAACTQREKWDTANDSSHDDGLLPSYPID
jgi:hypothetical protein